MKKMTKEQKSLISASILKTPEFQQALEENFDSHLQKSLVLSLKVSELFSGECHQTIMGALGILSAYMSDQLDADPDYGLTLYTITEFAKMARRKRALMIEPAAGNA